MGTATAPDAPKGALASIDINAALNRIIARFGQLPPPYRDIIEHLLFQPKFEVVGDADLVVMSRALGSEFDAQSMVGRVIGLERQGLVERSPFGTRYIRLSKKVRDLIQSLMPGSPSDEADEESADAAIDGADETASDDLAADQARINESESPAEPVGGESVALELGGAESVEAGPVTLAGAPPVSPSIQPGQLGVATTSSFGSHLSPEELHRRAVQLVPRPKPASYRPPPLGLVIPLRLDGTMLLIILAWLVEKDGFIPNHRAEELEQRLERTQVASLLKQAAQPGWDFLLYSPKPRNDRFAAITSRGVEVLVQAMSGSDTDRFIREVRAAYPLVPSYSKSAAEVTLVIPESPPTADDDVEPPGAQAEPEVVPRLALGSRDNDEPAIDTSVKADIGIGTAPPLDRGVLSQLLGEITGMRRDLTGLSEEVRQLRVDYGALVTAARSDAQTIRRLKDELEAQVREDEALKGTLEREFSRSSRTQIFREEAPEPYYWLAPVGSQQVKE